jgi:hypothetical protein
VFEVKVDRIKAIVEAVLSGPVELEEVQEFVHELEVALASLQGREIKMLGDLRGLKPVAPKAADLLRMSQTYALDLGVVRAAEIVDSEVVGLQLTRIARESGFDRVSRRFAEDAAAREWLLSEREALE